MKRAVFVCILLMLLIMPGVLQPGRQVVPEYALRYAENQAEDYPTTQAAYYFAQLVAERSDGRIQIFVYPDAALGDERSMIEQMQYGGIDFGRVNLSPLSEYDERLFALQLPYLYESSEHMWRVLEGEIGDGYLAGLSDIHIVGLSWVDAGARNFYTKTPIQKLEDLQGLRIRVQENRMMERLVALLGAQAVQMRYGDVLSALQTGKIDGAENNYSSYCSTGHYLVAQYMLEDAHSRIPEVMVASQAVMQRLSEEDQAMIAQAAQEAAVYQRELWKVYEEAMRKEVIASGCVVYTLSAEEKAVLKALTEPMYEEFAGDAMDVIEAIWALGEETDADGQ